MDEAYANAAKKIKQLEADGVDMVEYQNKTRKLLLEKLGQMGLDSGLGDGSIESLMRNTVGSDPAMARKLEEGLKRRKEITEELVPWLEQNNFKFTIPTTMDVLFVSGEGKVRFSICKETENIYDIQMYHKTLSSEPYINKALGYNPSKKLMSEGLKQELLDLRTFNP
jgi:hypothetical protein